MQTTRKFEYPNGEIAVIWKPSLCTHSGVCVKTLPKVYRPRESPWVRQEFASTDELIAQINKCPSAALTYRTLAEEEKAKS